MSLPMGLCMHTAVRAFFDAPLVAAAFCWSLLCPRGWHVFSVVGALVSSGSGPAVPGPRVFSHTRFFLGLFPGVARDLYRREFARELFSTVCFLYALGRSV